MPSRMQYALATLATCATVLFPIFSGCNTATEEKLDVASESIYQQVVKTKVLHAGYFIDPPYILRDKQNNLSGVAVEFTNKFAQRLGWKIEWVEATSLATMSVDLETGKFDLVVSPLWRSAERAGKVWFSEPLFYTVVGTYVSAHDREIHYISDLNRTSVRISGIDGELALDIAKQEAPNATRSALPNLVSYSDLLLQVASGKADATFYSRVQASRFIKLHPDSVKEIDPAHPVRVFAECWILRKGEYQLKQLVDVTLLELIENGALEAAFRAAGEDPLDYYFRQPPYALAGAIR